MIVRLPIVPPRLFNEAIGPDLIASATFTKYALTTFLTNG